MPSPRYAAVCFFIHYSSYFPHLYLCCFFIPKRTTHHVRCGREKIECQGVLSWQASWKNQRQRPFILFSLVYQQTIPSILSIKGSFLQDRSVFVFYKKLSPSLFYFRGINLIPSQGRLYPHFLMPVGLRFRLPNLYLFAFINNNLARPLQMHDGAVAAFGPECGFSSFTVVSKPSRLVTRQHHLAMR